MTDIAGLGIVLVTLLLIFGTIIFGVRHGTGRGLARAFGPTRQNTRSAFGVTTFFGGITAAVAVLEVSVAADENFAGAQSIGTIVGIAFAALVIAHWASPGGGVIVSTIREAIEGFIGILAAIPATILYFAVARDNSTIWPFWLSVVIFVLLVLVVAMSLLRTFLGALALRGVPQVGILLALFSAISLIEFFMQPFHLAPGSFIDGPWWWVPFAGVLLVIVGCLVSPQLVLAAGGIMLMLAQLGVMSTVFRDTRILMAVILYVVLFGVVWFLVKKVILEAVLKVRGRSNG
ncbi:MAG: hypothetical protein KF761_07785 [Salinibacterium sp.]|nr:hypothetical protein [Salinibacterium sp.]